jgi:hypothetical protein
VVVDVVVEAFAERAADAGLAVAALGPFLAALAEQCADAVGAAGVGAPVVLGGNFLPAEAAVRDGAGVVVDGLDVGAVGHGGLGEYVGPGGVRNDLQRRRGGG